MLSVSWLGCSCFLESLLVSWQRDIYKKKTTTGILPLERAAVYVARAAQAFILSKQAAEWVFPQCKPSNKDPNYYFDKKPDLTQLDELRKAGFRATKHSCSQRPELGWVDREREWLICSFVDMVRLFFSPFESVTLSRKCFLPVKADAEACGFLMWLYVYKEAWMRLSVCLYRLLARWNNSLLLSASIYCQRCCIGHSYDRKSHSWLNI